MADETNRNETQQQDLGELLRIRREKLKALQDAGRDPFQITKFDVTHHTQDIKDNFDAMEGTEVSVAGRLMSKRGMGKVSFCDLQDKTGRIQLYARKDEMDEEEYNRFKKYDIGDIVGVEGEVFRTQRGEMSVRAKKITLLSKSLRPLPEKYHGLTDKEARYRQRYVDLIINPESKRNFEIRSKFVAYLRRYLDSIGFMEVETPVLSPIAGGANFNLPKDPIHGAGGGSSSTATCSAGDQDGEKASVEEAKRIAKRKMKDMGWDDGSQFECLDTIFTEESGWRWDAENPTSGAYGIPHSLPGSKMASAGQDWKTNAATQIKWGLGYIQQRYQSPCGAWAQSETTGWY